MRSVYEGQPEATGPGQVRVESPDVLGFAAWARSDSVVLPAAVARRKVLLLQLKAFADQSSQTLPASDSLPSPVTHRGSEGANVRSLVVSGLRGLGLRSQP